MTREDKNNLIEELKEKISNHSFFYIADSADLSVGEVNQLRKLCHEKGITFQVAKNTLIQKALEGCEGDYEKIKEVLKGPSSIMFTEVSNLPAKVIKEFRKKHKKPLLKAAYIDTAIFIGDESMDALAELKSKDELIGEIVGLLQSPMSNVIGALQSGGQKIAGIVKTLSEREGE